MIQLEQKELESEKKKRESERDRERVLIRVGAHGSMTNSFLAQASKLP